MADRSIHAKSWLAAGCGAFRSVQTISRSPVFSAPKGHNKTAQGIALGIYQRNSLALKGRNNLCVSCICFALSGRGVSDLIVPRALPWAVMFRPFQGKYRCPSNALQQGSRYGKGASQNGAVQLG